MRDDWVDVSLVNDLNYVKTGVAEYYEPKEYYSTGSIKGDSIASEGAYSYSDRPSRANRLGYLGDVLQARMKDTDKAILINNKLDQQLFSTGFIQIRPNPKILYSKYIFHYLKSIIFLNEKDKNCSGSTQSALNDKSAQNLSVPLAPIPIQRAIISKIETLFSDLDNGISDLKKALQQLKIYQQAVLKKAFEGAFTKGLNREIAIAEYKGSDSLPIGWRWVKLGETAEMCLGKMLDKAKNKGELKPYLGNINVRWGSFDLINLKQMRFEENEEKRYRIDKNDLIICEGGEPGRCAVWVSDKQMYIQKALHRVRFHRNNKPFYFYYYFVYLALTGGLTRYFTGTTIKHLTGRRLKEVLIPLPTSFPEQQEIVHEI